MQTTVLARIQGQRPDHDGGRTGPDPLAIEANLAHAVKDANKRSYNLSHYLKKRSDQIQQWAEYRDRLRDGAPVIDLATHRAA